MVETSHERSAGNIRSGSVQLHPFSRVNAISPGRRTDLNNHRGVLPVEEGGKDAIRLARAGGRFNGNVHRPGRRHHSLVRVQRWTLTSHSFSPDPQKRRTTGMQKGMEESYIEDLASHDGPAHALAFREGAAKRWCRGARRPAIAASKWARLGCRRAVDQRKATSVTAFSRAVAGSRGVEEAGMCVISSC